MLYKCYLVSVQGLPWRSFESLSGKISPLPSITLASRTMPFIPCWDAGQAKVVMALRLSGTVKGLDLTFPQRLTLSLTGFVSICPLTASSRRSVQCRENPLSQTFWSSHLQCGASISKKITAAVRECCEPCLSR